MTDTVKNTIIAGVFVLAAAVVGAMANKWADKPKSDGPLVTGIVVDSENREIGEAVVSIVGRTEQATSGDNGNFRIVMPKDSPEIVTLRVTKSGYSPQVQDTRVPAEGLTVQMRKQR
jgi:hypothetical protein